MKLSINEQYKLLEAQKQRKRTLKEIGFTRILNEIGITSESTVFKEIEITEEKQGELKKIFEDKYKEWYENPSKEILSECVGILEALTFIGMNISVSELFTEADWCNRISD